MLSNPLVRNPGLLLWEVHIWTAGANRGGDLSFNVRDCSVRVPVLLSLDRLPAAVQVDLVLRAPAAPCQVGPKKNDCMSSKTKSA